MEVSNLTMAVAELRLPRFASSDVKGWFRQIELDFTLKGIRNSRVKYSLMTSALPGEVFKIIPKDEEHRDYEGAKRAIIF
ncbi:Uncharacterized protein FKW44_003817 [Caligus rogercresseyi]|uniref:DUF7041 domain-containing protein n=1 Tax=Caligus rogercresseyi TaxID=217165 RepID=A0A7T8KM67_CALRO|nr:Uncharacterized protein FKW44_003817 [Caligus rogercresseyi]